MDVSRPAFKCFDDDGRLKRSGIVNLNFKFRNHQESDERCSYFFCFVFVFRDGLDRKCAYYNCCDRIWCSISSMGHRPTRLDRWTCSDVLVLFRHLLLFHSSQWLLQNWWSCFRKEKLHLHGCCPINPRYC